MEVNHNLMLNWNDVNECSDKTKDLHWRKIVEDERKFINNTGQEWLIMALPTTYSQRARLDDMNQDISSF